MNRKRPASDQDEVGDGVGPRIRRRLDPKEIERSPAELRIDRNQANNVGINQRGSTFDGNNNASGSSSIQNGNNTTINNYPPHLNTRYGHGLQEHQQELLESLRFAEQSDRYLSVERAYPNTCRWFLQTAKYVNWSKGNGKQNQNNFLWIKGKPGAGKSTLMKVLLANHPRRTKNGLVISFFFNARGGDLAKTTIGMYRALLVQLLEGRPSLQCLLNDFPRGHQWSIGSLQHIFEEAVQSLSETLFCYIDALDECEESQIRDMTSFLSELNSTDGRLYTCLASRHYPHITIPNAVHMKLEEQEEHSKDIALYVQNKLNIGHGRHSDEIRSYVQEKAAGVFMWVVLVVGILQKEFDKVGLNGAFRKRLKEIPKNLHDLLRDILTRDKLYKEELLLCIQWLLFAKRPLSLKELYFAIKSGLEPTALDECHSYNLSEDHMAKYILNCSKGLAELTNSHTMQFIHESVRDFLLKEKGLHTIWPNLDTNIAGQSHERLKQICLQHMPTEPITESHLPFPKYANQCILYHAEHAEQNGVSQSSFWSEFPQADWVHYHNILAYFDRHHYKQSVSLLYILSEADLGALITAQPAGQSCFRIEIEFYGTAIIAALLEGSETTVEALLRREMKRRNLHLTVKYVFGDAASSEYGFGVKRRTFEFSVPFSRKRSLLSYLAEIGHPGVLRVYLATEDCTVDLRNQNGPSPLSYTAKYGHAELVKLLVKKGAHINAADRDGCTPLYWSWNMDMAQLFIENGADVSAADRDGWTPLHRALHRGHMDIAQLLIEKGADVNAATKDGRTPLHLTLIRGYTEVAQLLIEKGAKK